MQCGWDAEMKYPSWRNKLRQDAIFSMRLLEAQYFSPWSLAVGSFVSEFSCQWIWYRKKVHTLVCDAQQRLQQQLWYLGWLTVLKVEVKFFLLRTFHGYRPYHCVSSPKYSLANAHTSPLSRTHSKRTVASTCWCYVNTFLHSSKNLITKYLPAYLVVSSGIVPGSKSASRSTPSPKSIITTTIYGRTNKTFKSLI